MSGAAVRHLFRAIAVAIAVLAWLDPSYETRGRPRIAVIDAGAEDGLTAELADRIASDGNVTLHRDPDADIWLVAARDWEAAVPAVPPGVSLSLIAPAAPAASLLLQSLDAPARIGPAARAPVVASFSAHGMRGASSTLTVRSGALVLARQTHRWTRDDEQLTAHFDVLLPRQGVNHLVVEAIEGPGRSRQSRADTAIVVDLQPLGVLVYEGRPSWTTTFARRALEDDARFAVRHAARVSRGIVTTAIAPQSRLTGGERLTADLLATQRVVIVGAPETLTADEVEALRAFVTRGGALVLAPDQRPAGPCESLLWRTPLDERLLDEPRTLPLADAPELALMASELVDARVLPAGGRAVASGRDTGTSIWTAPLGRGRVLFVGALDAWRFRGRRGEAFDRWWPQVVDWLGRDLVDDLRVESEPRAAAPGEPITVRVRLRDTDSPIALRLALARSTEAGGQPSEDVFRVWPDAESGVFTAVINAPQDPGVYAVSATSSTAGAGIAAHRRRRSLSTRWPDGHSRRTIAGGSRPHREAALQGHPPISQRAIHAGRGPGVERRHPMRSLWWLLPFTACLAAEWQLRRRAGLR